MEGVSRLADGPRDWVDRETGGVRNPREETSRRVRRDSIGLRGRADGRHCWSGEGGGIEFYETRREFRGWSFVAFGQYPSTLGLTLLTELWGDRSTREHQSC